MTIAAGFRCSNGIVLCADTEEGRSVSKSLARSKISFVKRNNLAVAFAGAGNYADYIDMAVEEISKLLGSSVSTLAEVEKKIEQGLLRVYEQRVRPDTKAMGIDCGFDLLIGACLLSERSSGSPFDPPEPLPAPVSFQLWASRYSAVTTVANYRLLGTGGEVADYLGERLYNPSLTVRQGVFLAIQVLRHAKTYGTGCGGRSDIYILDNQGVSPVDSTVDVPTVDQGFEAIDRAMAPLLFKYFDPLVLSSQFEEELSRFATEVRRLRTEYVELIESRARERLDQWD